MTQLVYVPGLKGPVPEKWPQPLTDMSGKVKPHLASHALDAKQAKLSLNELAAIFPPPIVGGQ